MALFAIFSVVAYVILILVLALNFGFVPEEIDTCDEYYSSSPSWDFYEIVFQIIHFIVDLTAVFLYYKFIMFLTLIREKLLLGAVFYAVHIAVFCVVIDFGAEECDLDYLRLIFSLFSYFDAPFILLPFIVGALYKKNTL